MPLKNVAQEIYGFEITDEDDTMYYMSINDQDPDDEKPWSFDQMSRYR